MVSKKREDKVDNIVETKKKIDILLDDLEVIAISLTVIRDRLSRIASLSYQEDSNQEVGKIDRIIDGLVKVRDEIKESSYSRMSKMLLDDD